MVRGGKGKRKKEKVRKEGKHENKVFVNGRKGGAEGRGMGKKESSYIIYRY